MAILLGGASAAQAQPQSGIVRPTYEPRYPSRELGAELYAGNCATCHGIAGQGITHPRPGAGGVLGQGPPLRGVGALAADFYLRTGYMPLANPHAEPEDLQQGDRVLLSDKEIRSLVSYVASLAPGPAIPTPDPGAGNISMGQQLFAEHCAGCHQIVGRGGFVTGARVPELQTVPATQIAEAVRIGPYLMPRFSTQQISDAQLNDIVKYVLSVRHPDNRGGWGIGNIGPIPEGLVTWWIAGPLLIGLCLLLGKRFGR
ncbi:MAG TPA: cytochrome c [Solirubrobacteraceae bacterium]|nr:cytochrome c [Solirubrobacteraceae bacterium]